MVDMEELKEKIRLADEKYDIEVGKAKAEAEVKEISLIAQDTSKALNTKLNTQLVTEIDTNPDIKNKIKETAGKIAEQGLLAQEKEVSASVKKATKKDDDSEFQLKEDVYRAFGQDTAPTDKWKQKLINSMYNIWFVLITIICFFSLAPFYIFVKVIETQKGILKFVTVAVGVILLILCLGGITYFILNKTGVIHQ